MKHPQPPTPIKTDNSTASDITNKTIIPRKTRSMDMKYYWIHDRVTQQQFIMYWKPGPDNNTDRFQSITHLLTINASIRTMLMIPLSPIHRAKRGCINYMLTFPIFINREDT